MHGLFAEPTRYPYGKWFVFDQPRVDPFAGQPQTGPRSLQESLTASRMLLLKQLAAERKEHVLVAPLAMKTAGT